MPAASPRWSKWSRSPGQGCRPPAARGWRDYPIGPWPTPRAGPAPLFALFYQVEIRHRQLRRYRGRLARRDPAAGGAAGLQPTGFVPWERTAAGRIRCTAATPSGRRGAPARPPCGSTPRPRRRAMPRRRSSSCCGRRPAAEGIARPALFKRPPAHPPRRFWCKFISHRHLLGPTGGPFPRASSTGSMHVNSAIFRPSPSQQDDPSWRRHTHLPISGGFLVPEVTSILAGKK